MRSRRTVRLHVEPRPLAAEVAHAADRILLATAVAEGPVLRVYTLDGDVLSLGRFHRRPVGADDIVMHRRRTGGRAVASGGGFAHVALYLPHRAALVADDPLALAPEQILNRCVRGLLGGLEALGVAARYPGLDLVTARSRAIAVLGLEVAPDGATLVDALVSVSREQSVLPMLLDRVDREGAVVARCWQVEEVTSIARESGAGASPEALAAAVARGMEHRLGVTCVAEPGGWCPQPEFVDGHAWLDGCPPVPLSASARTARISTQLGVLEVDTEIGSDGRVADIRLVGDFYAPSAAVARLEDGLRGRSVPLAGDAVRQAVLAAFAPPAFCLGVRDLREVADAILVATALS